MSRTSVSRKRRTAVLVPAALAALLVAAGPLSSVTGSGGAARTSADSPVTHFTVTDGNHGNGHGDHDPTEYNTKA